MASNMSPRSACHRSCRTKYGNDRHAINGVTQCVTSKKGPYSGRRYSGSSQYREPITRSTRCSPTQRQIAGFQALSKGDASSEILAHGCKRCASNRDIKRPITKKHKASQSLLESPQPLFAGLASTRKLSAAAMATSPRTVDLEKTHLRWRMGIRSRRRPDIRDRSGWLACKPDCLSGW